MPKSQVVELGDKIMEIYEPKYMTPDSKSEYFFRYVYYPSNLIISRAIPDGESPAL